MLKGELGTFSIGEVFQSLAINNHTGTLKITAPNRPQKLIYFEKGGITLFSSGGLGVSRIGEMLIRLQKITEEQLQEALEEQKESKEVLGAILLRKQVIGEKDLRYALERKVREELYDLFLWTEGSFEFHLDYFPDELIDDVQRLTRISLDVNSVTMEGLRQIDEWTLIHGSLRTFDEIFTHTGQPYSGDDVLCRHVMASVDGAKPVREILKTAPAGKFECCKTIHDLVVAGNLRPLGVSELLELSGASFGQRNYPQAAAYLQFATELEPENPEVSIRLGDAFSKYYQEESAAKAYLAALRILHQQGDFARATEIGERVLRTSVVPEADLELLFQAHLSLGNDKKAAVVAHQLVTPLQKRGEFATAASVIERLSARLPDDLNLKIQLATLIDQSGDRDRATSLLEDVAKNLEEKRRFRELIKILRFLAEMHPKRLDLKQRIAGAKTAQERLERRRRRQLTTAGVSVMALLLLVFVPLVYEIKSGESLSHCKRLEEIDGMAQDFTRSKQAYEQYISRYALSRKIGEARAALARIQGREQTRLRSAEHELLVRKREQEAKLQAMNQAVMSARSAAAVAESDGNLQKAHEIYRGLLRDYWEHPSTRSILLPLAITSNPSGATVTVDGKEIGKTPVSYRYQPGVVVQLGLTRDSCEPLGRSVELRDQWVLHFKLDRKPVGGFAPVASLHQPMVIAGERLLLLSRDGSLYGVNPADKAVVWQRSVGRFGDRLSNLGVRGGEVYLGTVSAEATAISASTGESRWISRLGSSVLAAPAVSEDGRWVAFGTTKGSVEVLENEKGNHVAKFATENEILAQPLFFGPVLVVGSTDNHVYGYSMETQDLVFVEDLGSDIVIDPCRVDGRAAVARKGGTVTLLDVAKGTPVWSWTTDAAEEEVVALAEAPDTVCAGTSRGRLVAIDSKTGAARWELSLGTGDVAGVCVSDDVLYATLQGGLVAAVDLAKREKSWDYRCEDGFLAPPVVVGGYVLFGSAGGKIQLIEVCE